jgi:hypothetical protein
LRRVEISHFGFQNAERALDQVTDMREDLAGRSIISRKRETGKSVRHIRHRDRQPKIDRREQMSQQMSVSLIIHN